MVEKFVSGKILRRWGAKTLRDFWIKDVKTLGR